MDIDYFKTIHKISSKTVVETSRTDPVHEWSDLVLRKIELHTKLPTTKMD